MLMYVGKSSLTLLKKLGIYTIGNLAHYNKKDLIKYIGKTGGIIHDYACGIDDSIVSLYNEIRIPKSISRGMTFEKDINDRYELEKYIKLLCDNVVSKLRIQKLKTSVISISLKYNDFTTISKQKTIECTDKFQNISNVALILLDEIYNNNRDIRAITIFLNNLSDINNQNQISIFESNNNNLKMEKVSNVVDKLKEKYGKNITFGKF
jgi:DNA polymerase IV